MTGKKKTDGHDSDSDNQQKSKKDQGFQFETEARAAHRRQQQQQQQQQQQPSQPMKSRRKTAPISPNRRSKSSTAMARDLASTSSTQFESKPVPQQTQPVQTEPKVLTLSERLASIGRITSTLDETSINDESVDSKK
jgi:hypothetical protein